METSFWQKRWQENQIGFHMNEVNPYLIKHWPNLKVQPGTTVFVPMCGKTVDLKWFALQQYKVLGVECSKKAIDEFFTEQKLIRNSVKKEAYTLHSHENIEILEGDFFDLNTAALSIVHAVYDRASLVALPDAMREAYVKLLVESLPKSVAILLVTIEYDQALMSGPPFSITQSEIERLYQPHFKVDVMSESEILDNQPRFKELGLTSMIERVYKIYR